MTDKSVPILREWELNENSTRYDHNLAAPSDETLITFWSIQTGLSLAAGLFTYVVFLGILLSKKTRQQPFNLYLIYLMIPDFTFSILCGLTCLLNAIHGSYLSQTMCNFQQWYIVWGIGSNCWLNALITRELYRLLRCSNSRMRYVLPTSRTVTVQALAVYIYCGFLGTWGLFEAENFPYHTLQMKGLACVSLEVDLASSLFFWLLFMPLFSVAPIVYVIYVTYQVRKRKLLPPSGQRRHLVVYFGRIVAVFLLMWGPYFLFGYVLNTWLPTIAIFIGGSLSHLQSATSAAVSLLKPDIRRAVVELLTCKCGRGNQSHPSTRSSVWNSISSSFGKSSKPSGSQDISESSSPQHLWPNEDGEYEGDDGNDDKKEPAKEQAIVDANLEEGQKQDTTSSNGNSSPNRDTADETVESERNTEHYDAASYSSVDMAGQLESGELPK